MLEVKIFEMKCLDCKEVKNSSEFNKNKNRPHGLNPICKSCCKVRSSKYLDKVKNTFEFIVKNRFKSIQQRSKNSKYSNSKSVSGNLQNLSYIRKGIELKFTEKEFLDFMLTQKETFYSILENGEKVVICRKDMTGHYSLDNMCVVSKPEADFIRFGKVCKKVNPRYNQSKKNENRKKYLKNKKIGD